MGDIPVALINEELQKLFLRISTCNTTQRKDRKQLIAEHERLEIFYSDEFFNSRGGVIRNICKSTLNLQPELKISIVDLQVDNVHTGKFLLC